MFQRTVTTPLIALVLGILVSGIPAELVAAEMTFSLAGNGGNCNGCEWVAAQGEITADTPARFRKYLENHGEVYLVVFHSEGGDLAAAIELGRLIRESGATTSVGQTLSFTGDISNNEETVPGVCASACVFAFMGGVERWVSPEDSLGVHQFYSTSNEDIESETVQKIVGLTLLHTLQMGVDPYVILAASGTSPERMHWFSPEELSVFGLDTSESFADSWRLEPHKAGLVLTTIYHESVRRSVGVTLFCRESTNRWHLLISEESDYWAKEIGYKRFVEISYQEPTISIGGRTLSLRPEELELQRVSRSLLLLSVPLPSGVQEKFGATMSFNPNLARVFSSLFYTSVTLPEQAWLRAVQGRCI